MEFHEAAKLFPLLEGDQFDAFVEDIRTEGQLETIKLLGGKVLDGRNRWRACEKLGIKPRTEELPSDTHPVRRVMSLNDKRRHLNDTQRAFIAAAASNMGHGGDRKSEQIKMPSGTLIPPPVSIHEAADLMHVPRRTVQRARKVKEKGIPEVVQAIEEEQMTLYHAAEEVVDLPPEEQLEAVKQATGKKKKEERNGNNGENKKQGVGIIRAHEAINCLNRIPKNDPSLKDAFKVVTDWIRHRRKELERGK